MNITFRMIVLALVLAAGVVSGIHVSAADVAAQKKEEDRISANEDEADAKTPLNQLKNDVYEGVLSLSDDDKPNPFGVVGTFDATDGKKYELKLIDANMLNQLKPLNEKKIKLEGKLRVNGKYLVVMRIAQTLIPPKRELPTRPGL